MLDWKRIYLLNDENNKRAGTVFEKLVLNYLSSVYRRYSWENTKNSWDNNRDFISLILDNIWGEAKYKKDSSSLGKKDIDPTMMSGFLNGRVELVFIITNGQIPSTINTRINEIGKKCGFTVVCITQIQLEYWLIAHPKQYLDFFGEPLPDVSQTTAFSIENVRLENQLDANFESSYIQPEFIVDSICNLCVTFSCNTDLECIIVEKEEYPFRFIESPEVKISPGVQQKNFPIKLIHASSEPIILEFRNIDNTILLYALDIKIVHNPNPPLIYAQQESIKIEICHAINTLPNTNDNHIFGIYGVFGYGKTFLMHTMANDLSFFHVVSVLQCEASDFSCLNSMKLCQMIMYFNYGDTYQEAEYTAEAKQYYKYMIIKKNHNSSIDNNMLTDIFEGCFDRIIATNVIEKLSKNAEDTIIIKKSHFARKHILFVDDVNLFSESELNVFRMIVRQLKRSSNNSILVFSSESPIFDESEIVAETLSGLSSNDITASLKKNLNIWQYNAFSSKIAAMPRFPKMISEIINYIINNTTTSLSLKNINTYITNLNNSKLSNIQFDLADEEAIVLDLIYNFSKGIDKNLLQIVGIKEEILESLYNKGCILYFKQRYIPCMDYLQYVYKNQQKNLLPNEHLVKYLHSLLNKAYMDPLFDIFQAQALFIRCNRKLYLQVKETYKTKMIEYINEGNYKGAILYGEIFCFDVLKDNRYCQETDLDALFYYGIALIHSDSQRRAIDIFTYVKNHSEKNSLTYFKASAELLNNRYSRFQIKEILPEAIILKHDIYTALSCNLDEDASETHQLRIAYSTCMNRMMMIYFLKDNKEKALEIYDEFCQYHLTLPSCNFSSKYDSMLYEWKMDCARGLVAYNIQDSIYLNKQCYDCFDENIDNRRTILCKIDKLFFEAILNNNYEDAICGLIKYQQELSVKEIVSEEMKTSIRITYCRLMKYVCIPEFEEISLLAPFVDEIYAEIFSTQLESHVIAQGRTAYLLNNLLAILHIIKNDINTAAEMLQYSGQLVQECGTQYRQIIEHNYNHLNEIQKIKWYFYNDIMYDDTYYLDVRVW